MNRDRAWDEGAMLVCCFGYAWLTIEMFQWYEDRIGNGGMRRLYMTVHVYVDVLGSWIFLILSAFISSVPSRYFLGYDCVNNYC